MTHFPPLKVAVSGPRQSCVVDVPLALAPGGLLFTLRLANEANVFLGRELWHTLDNLDLLLEQPEDKTASDVKLWKLARLDTPINQLGLYWAGESRRESLLPEDQDKQFLQRYELLAQALDDQRGEDGETWAVGDEQQSCVDTLALAGALMPYRPIIFTTGADHSPLLPYLQNHLKLQALPRTAAQQARAYFRPLFFRTGVSDLLWHGLELTAVHLVAPQTLVLPAQEPNKSHYDPRWTEWQDYEPDLNAWEGAAAYWYSLTEVVT